MNMEILAAGRRLDATIEDTSMAVRELAIDVQDTWPGRRAEAELHANRVARALQDARAELGVLIAVLAQDGST
jgi:SHS2 domain-containing protein